MWDGLGLYGLSCAGSVASCFAGVGGGGCLNVYMRRDAGDMGERIWFSV